ncbi:N-acetylmuramoyl-L-alanine amidase [Virgibacillus xinjiangensis]|uniref:N-acetylmuramoyl-L-alanine amidase n=1 Tax=Virgibacillus xinjiangensis TaxID=393090 RepID=A0ABV7CTH0_9BACI
MKHKLMVGIGFFVCLFIFEPTVHADSGQLYEVHSETVNLREAPDQGGEVLAYLNSGAQVTIFQESNGWGRTFYNGKEAWIALYLLVEKSESTEAAVSGANEEVNRQQTSEDTEEEESETASAPNNEGEEAEVDESEGSAAEVREEDANEKVDRQQMPENIEEEESETVSAPKNEDEKAEVSDEGEASPAEVREEDANEKVDRQQMPEDIEEEESETVSPQNYEDEEAEENDEKEASPAEVREENVNQDARREQIGEKALSGYHFVIDPGHGGKDTGAVRSGVDEKTINLSTARKLYEQLRDKGASVTLTRTEDTFISVDQRVQLSNSTAADAFISLHYNTFKDQSISGVDIFYNNGSQELAESVQKSLVRHVQLTDRGSKQADYKVLRENRQLALLIELGFISNPEERELVQTDGYQEKAAKGIVAGLEDHFSKD